MLLALVLLGAPARTAEAQGAASPLRLQLGPGFFPDAGVQVGFVAPRGFYTTEGVLYVDATAPFSEERRRVRATGVVGGAVRLVGIMNYFREQALPYHVDLGLRLGPGLRFKARETRAEKNQRFRLVFEPFLRFTYAFERGFTVFTETGSARPYLRAGLWLRL